ncbi:MAG: hypothetical protein BWX70_02903 [Verrucomicrobia bacterium ADurb.Bin070]|nr:MAG: hypothetical protein BWX70_02903 [Verrucomicrobia bacterium ADurb.Bin070]
MPVGFSRLLNQTGMASVKGMPHGMSGRAAKAHPAGMRAETIPCAPSLLRVIGLLYRKRTSETLLRVLVRPYSVMVWVSAGSTL